MYELFVNQIFDIMCKYFINIDPYQISFIIFVKRNFDLRLLYKLCKDAVVRIYFQ